VEERQSAGSGQRSCKQKLVAAWTLVSDSPASTALLDVFAMLKSLIAALSILSLLHDRSAIYCNDQSYGSNYNRLAVLVPSWYLRQECAPQLDNDGAKKLFVAFIVGNQITFAVTSVLLHSNLGGLKTNPARAKMRISIAYVLGVCSFIFGFCKMLLVVYMALIVSITYKCDFPTPLFVGSDGIHCSDKDVAVDPDRLPGVGTFPAFVLSNACRKNCHAQVPPEVFVLAVTFLLTFVYSLFMVEELISPQKNGGTASPRSTKSSSNRSRT